MRKDNLNKKKVLIAIIIGILLLVLGLTFFFLLKGDSGKSDDALLRQNTFALVRTYIEKEEFDRALSLLENVLIQNPDDTDASELLDAVLRAKRAKQGLESGSSGISMEDFQAALDAARRAVDKVSQVADEAQKAASRMTSAQQAQQEELIKQAQQAKQNQLVEQAEQADSSSSIADEQKQRQEQAAQEAAKRKAAEELLSQKNEETKRKISEVNEYVAKGKEKAEAGSLRSALSAFEQAKILFRPVKKLLPLKNTPKWQNHCFLSLKMKQIVP